jgi:AcrR family transcriptional regulator
MAEARQRRRGAELEEAILEAAWEELVAVGYQRLTMEGIAVRAGTSKPVLYRRWPNRAQLIIAALRTRVTSLVEDVPDTGELRGDLLALLRRARDHFDVLQRAAPDVMRGFFSEIDALTVETELFVPESMRILLRRAGERGEIDPAAVPPRVVRLPLDINRHEILITGRPPTDEAIAEMVDQIVLPVLRALPGSRLTAPAAPRQGGVTA